MHENTKFQRGYKMTKLFIFATIRKKFSINLAVDIFHSPNFYAYKY